jgi:hypothetical protein
MISDCYRVHGKTYSALKAIIVKNSRLCGAIASSISAYK